MSELAKRILFALPAAILFLGLTWLGGFWFVGLVVIISLFTQRELSMLMDSAGFKAEEFFPYTIGVWILLTPFSEHDLAIGLVIFLLFVGIQIFKTRERGLKELINTAFCGIYAPLGFLPLILLRETGSMQTGFVLTVSLLLMVWGNDVFAYFGGKAFGKHSLAPDISPNKTWEGFCFGILGAVAGLLLVYYTSPTGYPVPLLVILPAALLISIFGPIGDLSASRIKRAADAKDASGLLPGHGGLFDRFDALILAAPAFYLYIYLLEIIGNVSF